MNIMPSRGGSDVATATFRSARPTDTDVIYQLSLSFMKSGALLIRDKGFFDAQVQNFHVVELNHTVVACAGIHRFSDTAEIFNLVVKQQCQRHGLGRFLLASLITVLHAEGIGKVMLFSSTSTKWFQRCGFVPMELAALPPERLALLDQARGSIPMSRATGRCQVVGCRGRCHV